MRLEGPGFERVFPARAGMIPATAEEHHRPTGIPRESGDDPVINDYIVRLVGYSPRERG